MMKSGQGPLKKVDSSPTVNLDKMLCHVTGTMACHQKIRQRTYIDSCHWTDHLQKRDFLKPDWWEMLVKRSFWSKPCDRWNIHPAFPGFEDCLSPFFQKNPPVKTGCHQGRAHQRMTAARPKPRSSPPRCWNTFKWESIQEQIKVNGMILVKLARDRKHEFCTPNGGWVREIPFSGINPGWWNIIIWPDDWYS